MKIKSRSFFTSKNWVTFFDRKSSEITLLFTGHTTQVIRIIQLRKKKFVKKLTHLLEKKIARVSLHYLNNYLISLSPACRRLYNAGISISYC